MKSKKEKVNEVKIPYGCFHGNDNCSDCIYWERNNRTLMIVGIAIIMVHIIIHQSVRDVGGMKRGKNDC